MLKALSLALAILCAASAAQAGTDNGLASPMVDRSIYKPGAVVRTTGRFAGWTVFCDQITALRQRFCSLRSLSGRDAYGQTVRIDVSTGDNGKPAALLHLPLLISLASGLEIRLAPEKTGATRGGEIRRKVAVTSCTTRECLAVWTLDASALNALMTGGRLDLAYCSIRPGALEFATDLRRRACEAHLASGLSGAGFHEAVMAATH